MTDRNTIDPESGCRLAMPKPEDLDDRGRAVIERQLDPARRSIVGMRGPSGIRLHSPFLAEHSQALVMFYRKESVLDARTQEIAILVTARAHRSEFEWSAHDPAARRAGVPDAVIAAIRTDAPTDRVEGMEERDALIIAVGRELFATRGLSQPLYDAALAEFGSRGLVELISLMAMYAGTAHLLAAFDMQLPDGAEPVMG